MRICTVEVSYISYRLEYWVFLFQWLNILYCVIDQLGNVDYVNYIYCKSRYLMIPTVCWLNPLQSSSITVFAGYKPLFLTKASFPRRRPKTRAPELAPRGIAHQFQESWPWTSGISWIYWIHWICRLGRKFHWLLLSCRNDQTMHDLLFLLNQSLWPLLCGLGS